jgi:hypothetical protein
MMPDDITADPVIADALQEKKITLTAESFSSIRRSREYLSYMERAGRDAYSRSAEMITAAVLNNSSALKNITDNARYELAILVRDLLTDTNALPDMQEKIKAIRALAQCLASLSTAAMDRKLARRETLIAGLKKGMLRLEAEKKQLEAELILWKERAGAADAERIVSELNKQVGL